jgi:acetyltransferase-like isoleucine patch superfamily enzyme
MGLMVKSMTVVPGAWVGTFVRIASRVTVGAGAVVTLGSVLLKDAQPNGIYTGNPATLVGERTIRNQPGPTAGVQS